jgi:arginase
MREQNPCHRAVAATKKSESVLKPPMRVAPTIIEAPSNLGLKPRRPGAEPGVRRLPEALAAAGLASALAASPGGRVPPPPYAPGVDRATRIRNAPAIACYSAALADRVGQALDRGEFPLVLGGDCSILLGTLLALRRRGRSGLFFLDGHADFATPETSPSLAAAGMDLALATGIGPPLLADMEGRRPLVRPEDVVAVGFRDETPPAPIAGWSVARLRAAGPIETMRREAERLASAGAKRFWIHVDADVLDPSVMPAVDTPEPGGFRLEELAVLLRALLATERAAGMQLCIFDPDLDPEGRFARSLCGILASAFGSDGASP